MESLPDEVLGLIFAAVIQRDFKDGLREGEWKRAASILATSRKLRVAFLNHVVKLDLIIRKQTRVPSILQQCPNVVEIVFRGGLKYSGSLDDWVKTAESLRRLTFIQQRSTPARFLAAVARVGKLVELKSLVSPGVSLESARDILSSCPIQSLSLITDYSVPLEFQPLVRALSITNITSLSIAGVFHTPDSAPRQLIEVCRRIEFLEVRDVHPRTDCTDSFAEFAVRRRPSLAHIILCFRRVSSNWLLEHKHFFAAMALNRGELAPQSPLKLRVEAPGVKRNDVEGFVSHLNEEMEGGVAFNLHFRLLINPTDTAFLGLRPPSYVVQFGPRPERWQLHPCDSIAI